DSAVVLKTFNALARTHKEVPRKPLTAIRKHMKSFRDVEVDFPVADVVERLEAADMRIETLRFREKGFAVFSGGVGTVYADGREQLAACMKAPTVANFHEWRKNVKYLWHHMEILTPTWEGLTATYAESLHTLADYLGDDHDLAVLKDTLVELPDDVGDPDAVYQLITIIDVEREQLQENAIRLGKRIYAEDPVQFVRRTRSYYKLWRQEQRQQV
ncbi:MAG: CHAD domain-containing protein, partial [Chloroflexota bacterium]